MSELLKQIASPTNLNLAWRKYRNDKAIWCSGVPRFEMEPDVVYHLLKMSDELTSGNYNPDPVRFFFVNKGNGKKRLISAYTLRDKVAQRAVLSVLEPIFESFFHYDSFGYRPGRSIQMALSRVMDYVFGGMTWIVDADILECFDNVSHDLLIRILNSFIPDHCLIQLIKRWIDAGNIVSGEKSRKKGLPQGAVLSPFLCNVYLSWWDYKMHAKGFPFVRFADDFLAFAISEHEAERVCFYAGKTLNDIGLQLHPKKTAVVPFSHDIHFLGQRIINFYNI